MSEHGSSADIDILQETVAQQQKTVSDLKEMIAQKSDTDQGTSSSSLSATAEKVKNISKTFTKLKAKARGAFYSGNTKLSGETNPAQSESNFSLPNPEMPKLLQQLSAPSPPPTSTSSKGSKKLQLLQQKLQQTNVLMAERAESQLHLEQKILNMKEQFDTTQQCIEDTSLMGKSMNDLSDGLRLTTPVVVTTTSTSKQRHRSATDLSSQPFNLEKERIKFLENRCRMLEKQFEKERKQFAADCTEETKRRQEVEKRVLELEQQLRETQNHPEDETLKSRISELEEALQQNHDRVMELEQLVEKQKEEIHEKTIKQQKLTAENKLFRVELSEKLGKVFEDDDDEDEDEPPDNESKHFEIMELRDENSRFSKRIAELVEINDELETARCDLASSNSVYKERVQDLEDELKKMMVENSEMHSLRDHTEKQTTDDFKPDTDTESLIKTEMAKQIQELQELNEKLNCENEKLKEAIASHEEVEVDDMQIKNKLSNLEATIESQRDELTARQTALNKMEEELMEKTIELNVLNANFRVLEDKLQALNKSRNKPLFSTATKSDSDEEHDSDLQAEVQQLKQKLDESNKAMIKLKLKCKQSEKQIEKLGKGSNLHEELIELQKANDQLQQKITELEDEKGQWQLAQLKEKDDGNSDDGKTVEKAQADTIRLLEEQNYEQNEELEKLRKELENLKRQAQSQERVVVARVESEMSEIHMEEQLEELKQELKALQKQLDENNDSYSTLQQQYEDSQLEKHNLEKKLEHYVNENMELLDKVEKLSKSSSSAESIEIVDRLTQQERAEMDEFNKRMSHSHDDPVQHTTQPSVSEITQTDNSMGYELGESLVKLREESSELMNKVAMFTSERREVLEKMEHLTNDNHELIQRVELLTQEKRALESQIHEADEAKAKLEIELKTLGKEKELLTTQIAESSARGAQQGRELTSMQTSSEIIAALDSNEGCITLFDKCEKSLSRLDAELEAYRRANDKNAKFNASKKLAKEAKNALVQLSELLTKVKEASSAVETVTVVETVVAVTAPNGKALAEYEQLTAQNRELKLTVDDLRQKLVELEDTNLHETISGMVEIKPTEVLPVKDNKESKSEESLAKLRKYEEECMSLKTTVDELREKLLTVNLENESKTGEISRLNDQLKELQKISKKFEEMVNDKETSIAKQAEQFIRLRKELEGKCEVYEGEMEILQTLATEQKQQLIEAYKEHEHEMNLKLLDLQQRDEQISKMRDELTELRQVSRATGKELSDDLEKECERLKETLRITKTLVAEQIDELANKQDTIEMLNQQLIELYKTMEENTNKVIEKEDEIADLKATIDKNKSEFNRLRKDNEEQKSVVDKLLSELHSHKENKQQIVQLESEVQALRILKLDLEDANKELEKRCKEQLEKMKKYAVNLKKRAAQCQQLEAKVQEYEAKSKDGEIQQELTANVVLLNERILDYEFKNKTLEDNLTEIQEALQAKTIEILESMENNEKLEQEMKSLQNELVQRNQDIVQLHNALAASQEQAATSNDWTESANKEEINELNEQLQKVQSELLIARELLMEKDQAIQELQSEQEEKASVQDKLQLLQAQVKEHVTKLNDADNQLQQRSQEIQKITEELSAKSLKFEKSKAVIKERNNQIHRLQAQIKELQDKLAAQPEEEQVDTISKEAITSLGAVPPSTGQVQANTVPASAYEDLKTAYANLNAQYVNEKSTFEQTIARLETLHDGIQAKLQEDMSYIETIELENARFKEKICKLEECVNTFEERRSSMERRANLLDAQMQNRTDEYVKAEDELIYRLNMLSEHDEVIAQRLMDSLEEKDDLQDRLEKVQREFTELTAQHIKLEKEYKNFKEQSEAQVDTELHMLRQKVQVDEAETQRIRATYDAKLATKTTELDDLEAELSDQLARMNNEKRSLQEELEKSHEECGALKDEIMRLNESMNSIEQAKQEAERELSWLRMQNENSEQDQYDLQELRMQAMQDKTEIDNLRQQIESLASNHQVEVEALRRQIADLDSLRMQVGQNQTDDQVFIETENKRLTDLLSEKEAIIAEYQRQNLQLQMAVNVARGSQQTPDLFASIGATDNVQQINQISAAELHNNNALLEQELAEKNNLIRRLQSDISNFEAQIRNMNAERSVPADSISNTPMTVSVNNDLIPAPAMFFSSSQVTPSPFDEIVQQSHETPQYAAVPSQFQVVPDALEQPTIEDLQRNVSDLEKYAQELEHKLAARNNQEEELRQRVNEARVRQANTEQELLLIHEQLKLTEKHLHESVTLKESLENRISELEVQLNERDEQLSLATSNAFNAEQSKEKTVELEQQLQEYEFKLKAREAHIEEFKKQLELNMKVSPELETQIIPATATDEKDSKLFKRDVGPTLDMFFGNTPAAATSVFEDIIVPAQQMPIISDVPVVEDVIVPEKAYQCYPEGETAVPTSSGDFNLDLGDDVWGGSSDDAHWGGVETTTQFAQTAQPASLLSHEQQLELDLTTSRERIKELEDTLEANESQKQRLQEKLAKSMKVVSKYKTQNEELKKNNSGSNTSQTANFFDDLDAAIQDELKQQISKLEAELSEQQKLQKEAAIEKEKLLKRIDVLTAGNERMAEMKERQDMDMDMYKTRISELQQKLSTLEDWDGTTNDVNQNLTEKKEEIVIVAEQGNPSEMGMKIQEIESRVKSLLAEIDDLNGDKQELQALLDEERATQNNQDYQRQYAELNVEYNKICSELEALKSTQVTLEAVNKRLHNELDDQRRILEAARSDAALCDDFKQMCMELENKLKIEEAQFAKEKTILENQYEDLKIELENVRSSLTSSTMPSQAELESDSGIDAAKFDEMLMQLQEKDVEIMHLKQRVEDVLREDQTEKLVLEILSKNQEIHMLKMQVKNLEDDKQELESNLSLQITQEMQQKQHSQQTEQHTDENKEKEMLKRTEELESQIQELQKEKRQMEEELNVLNAHVLSSLELEDKLKAAALDVDMKNMEIKELRQTVEKLRKESVDTAVSITQQPNQAAEISAHWEALVEQRCSEIAQMWRMHLEQRETEFQATEQRLKSEIDALQREKSQQPQTIVSALPTHPRNISIDNSAAGSASSTPVSSASASASPSASADSSSAEASKDCSPLHIINEADADELISKMQRALESQEMEIITLKEHLAIRSAEYARLAAQYDPFKSDSKFNYSRTAVQQRSGENNSALTPKHELDLTLYMLHERDMRVEELTVELVALLEERDTLQLKLSDTIRQMEAIKTQFNYVEPAQSTFESSGAGSSSGTQSAPTSMDSPQKSISSTLADESAHVLHQKLSQLHTVNHSKDKLIKEEREHRIRQMEQIRQMERIQQDVAKMPTAAVSELITDISQSNQSPSSALLNWLWGNKPPGSDGGGGTAMN